MENILHSLSLYVYLFDCVCSIFCSSSFVMFLFFFACAFDHRIILYLIFPRSLIPWPRRHWSKASLMTISFHSHSPENSGIFFPISFSFSIYLTNKAESILGTANPSEKESKMISPLSHHFSFFRFFFLLSYAKLFTNIRYPSHPLIDEGRR